jgi:glucosyl-3-phosphoglycerate synthase
LQGCIFVLVTHVHFSPALNSYRMITVIIPALNEEKTIGNVVRFCSSHVLVTEVIVVDDRSADRTAEEARQAGALVITSAKLGKGISMKEGIQYARNEIIVFLDGDIDPYPLETISRLADPVISDEADFVKATFSRNAGRVTELLAKPLLTLLYPELAAFSQPLSGMIAGRKKLFGQIDFLHDYGVDIGILVDMFLMGARIREADIGFIQNKSKPWHSLAKMSTEVAGAILQKSLAHRIDTRSSSDTGSYSHIKKAEL